MHGFDRIIGYEDVKKELIMCCDVLKNAEKYASLGVVLPRGILLNGMPGIGKTLMAMSFIEEVGWDSYTIRKDKSDGDFVNEIRETFEKARKSHKAIVFLDDMDKFANEDEKHPDAEEYVTIQSCIDESRDENVFVIATINEKKYLPKSLLRAGRFDKVFDINPPCDEDRIKLVKFFLDQKVVSEELDPDEVSRLTADLSIADVENAINEAGINAGFEARSCIERRDIIRSITRNLFEAPENIREESTDLEVVVVHELGHVITAEALEPGSVNIVSIESHSGCIGGITQIRSEKEKALSMEYAEHKAVWSLGGRAATEMVFGTPDMGSQEDIFQSYEVLEQMIRGEAGKGFELLWRMGSAGSFMLDKAEIAIAHEMERCYQSAKKIIVEYRSLLDALTEELKEKKTLTYKDIQEIKSSLAAQM